MTNAFNWRKFTDEERANRGEKKDAGMVSRKRSVASSKAVEKKRETQSDYGTVGMNAKTAAVVALMPKTFTVYSKARKAE